MCQIPSQRIKLRHFLKCPVCKQSPAREDCEAKVRKFPIPVLWAGRESPSMERHRLGPDIGVGFWPASSSEGCCSSGSFCILFRIYRTGLICQEAIHYIMHPYIMTPCRYEAGILSGRILSGRILSGWLREAGNAWPQGRVIPREFSANSCFIPRMSLAGGLLACANFRTFAGWLRKRNKRKHDT